MAEKLEDETTDLWILFQPLYKFQSNEKKPWIIAKVSLFFTRMDNC